jgi:hypothetical protein
MDTTFGNNGNGSEYYNMMSNNHDYGLTISISPTDDIAISVVSAQRLKEQVLVFDKDGKTHQLVMETDATDGMEYIDIAHAKFLENGKLMLAGRELGKSSVWLFNDSLQADTLLNGSGKKTYSYYDGITPQSSIFLDFMEQEDEKIVLAGHLSYGAQQAEQKAMLVRLTHKQVIPTPVDTTDTLVDDSTSGMMSAKTMRVNIYPNPVQSAIQIEIAPDHLPADFVMFDIHGRKLMQHRLTSPASVIEVPLDPGCYLLEIEGKEGIVRKKIMRE